MSARGLLIVLCVAAFIAGCRPAEPDVVIIPEPPVVCDEAASQPLVVQNFYKVKNSPDFTTNDELAIALSFYLQALTPEEKLTLAHGVACDPDSYNAAIELFLELEKDDELLLVFERMITEGLDMMPVSYRLSQLSEPKDRAAKIWVSLTKYLLSKLDTYPLLEKSHVEEFFCELSNNIEGCRTREGIEKRVRELDDELRQLSSESK